MRTKYRLMKAIQEHADREYNQVREEAQEEYEAFIQIRQDKEDICKTAPFQKCNNAEGCQKCEHLKE